MKRLLASFLIALSLLTQQALATDRKPLVIISGQTKQMPAGDTVGVDAGGTGGTTASAARTSLGLGTFATSDAATPPAIGGTTPAAGKFTTLQSTSTTTLPITGSTQCLHVNTSGVISGTGADCGTGSGSVGTSGTPASGNLAKFSGSATITNGDLSGDCTTSGTLAVTCTKTGGVSFATSATTDTTSASNISSGTLPAARIASNDVALSKLAQSGANTMLGNWTGSTANVAANSMPSCADTGGNHLNYVSGTGVTCGTSGSGGTTQTTGTWTPSIKIGGATTGITYSNQNGYYIRTGDMIVCSGLIVLSSKGALTGNLTIEGLPFFSKNSTLYQASGVVSYYSMAANGPYFIEVGANSKSLVTLVSNGTAAVSATYLALNNNSEIDFTITYQLEPGQ